jgi:uncharacterized protein YggE
LAQPDKGEANTKIVILFGFLRIYIRDGLLNKEYECGFNHGQEIKEERIKNKVVVFLAIGVLVVTAVVGMTGCSPVGTVSAQTQPVNVNVNGQQGIWVSGQGKVTVTPNIVMVNMGVQSQSAAVADAQAQASTAMDKVMTALAANGVDKKDIQTQNYNIQQLLKYDNYNQTNTITGYQVNNMVNVKIRSIDKAGSIIDAAVTAGGDNIRINGVNFTVDQPEQYYTQARQAAMSDALAKAQNLAKLSGVTLGRATYITESVNTPYQPYFNGPISMSGNSFAAAAPMPAPYINPGESDIILAVQVSYSIQ